MNKFKGIIFDFDGTLADSLPVCILAFQKALEKITGQLITEKEIKKHFGKSEEGIVAALAPEHYDKALSAYIEEYRDNHHLCPDLFDGMIDILDKLREEGYKLALITGKGKKTIDIALEYMNLEEYFEYVEHGHPEKSIKAESMIKISKCWGISPSEIAYIGDQPTDIIDSKKAGVKAIAVSWAKTSNHSELEKHEPDFIFSDINDFRHSIIGGGKGSVSPS